MMKNETLYIDYPDLETSVIVKYAISSSRVYGVDTDFYDFTFALNDETFIRNELVRAWFNINENCMIADLELVQKQAVSIPLMTAIINTIKAIVDDV